MGERQLQYCKFIVNEKPYCIWDWDFKERIITFLKSIDHEYFVYFAKQHSDALTGEQKQRAALAIRTAYVQGLETLFAFICAAIQAPECIPAWLVKYSNHDLDNLIGKVNESLPIYSTFGYKAVSWDQISEEIHINLILGDKEKEQLIKQEYSNLWSRFARDFTNDKINREYNSIKHGFRVHSGGFTLAVGKEEKPGTQASADKMHLLGKSDFGSSFLIPENISEAKDTNHHFQIKGYSLNWNPEDMLCGLQLISMSINNIISYLKVMNGVSAETVQFLWPPDKEFFHEPWKRSSMMGVYGFGWYEYRISENDIEKYSKEDIISVYQNNLPENNKL